VPFIRVGPLMPFDCGSLLHLVEHALTAPFAAVLVALTPVPFMQGLEDLMRVTPAEEQRCNSTFYVCLCSG
jgi:hypothetical protein